MTADQHIWRLWADRLHDWGIDHLAANFIETSGPLTILGAQLLYLGEPFLARILPPGHWNALASMLSEPEATGSFATLLREVPK